ncbi:LPXTG cell wall anchor domain-containing protein [Thomasclavelia cocleata]|uniref:LPXTG cell wall anchor domain-containing protein n=1 Tax=Thomasclavelia cocleata TaxID=69824 RepID=UPI0034E5F0B6
MEVNSGSKVDTSTLVKPGDTTVSVKTGDETSLGMLMSLVGLSVLGLVYSKRKRESI